MFYVSVIDPDALWDFIWQYAPYTSYSDLKPTHWAVKYALWVGVGIEMSTQYLPDHQPMI